MKEIEKNNNFVSSWELYGPKFKKFSSIRALNHLPYFLKDFPHC